MPNNWIVDWREKAGFLLAAASLMAMANAAAASEQSGESDDDPSQAIQLAPIEVTASRFATSAESMSRAVTVITREDIEKQASVSQNLAEALGKLVPGMAPSSGTLTNFSQTMRGRNSLVLIDGVPMNTNRNISRDLFNIDLDAIESIEVIKGGSALYGNGAPGGIIKITTREGSQSETPVFETEIGAALGLSHIDDESLSGRFTQRGSGTVGNFDYLASVTAEMTQGFFSADGDRIPPEPSQGGLSDTDTYDLLGKLAHERDGQRFALSMNYLNSEQDTDYTSDVSVNSIPDGEADAQAIEGLQLDEQTSNRNFLANLSFDDDDVLDGTFQSNVYYRNYHSRFAPFDGRAFSTWNALAQTYLDSEVWGGRVAFDTPIEFSDDLGVDILWGFDYNDETTEMPVTTYDGTAFDNSGGLVFVDTGDRTFMPELHTRMAGAYGQLEISPIDPLTLRAGVRYDYAHASFGDFTTLGQGNQIEGGSVDYTAVTYNAGAVYDVTQDVSVYADYAEAFELPDIGLQLRYAPANFDINSSDLDPVITDNFEVGVRTDFGDVRGSFAAFYNRSKLGRVIVENFGLSQSRQKERVYGIEGTLDYAFNEDWTVGGTATWMEGESYNESQQKWQALNSYRIPPYKLTAYVEGSLQDWWKSRLQILHSGNRDSAQDDSVGFGGRKVEDYTVVDLYNSFDLPVGVLQVGVENLLNEQYYNVYGQLLRNGSNSSHVLARGATLRVGYNFKW